MSGAFIGYTRRLLHVDAEDKIRHQVAYGILIAFRTGGSKSRSGLLLGVSATIERDGFANQHLHEALHAIAKMKDDAESRLVLDATTQSRLLVS